MYRSVVFGTVVGEIVFSWFPVELEEVLRSPVFKPVEAHVHCLGLFGLYFPIDNSVCGGVVHLDRCPALWMSHFFYPARLRALGSLRYDASL